MKKKFIGSIIVAFIPILMFSQNNKAVYNWFDAQIGIENTGLSNGIEYIDSEKGSNGQTKFLYADNFSTGFISYDGQVYYDVTLTYNVYDEKIIVNIGQNSSKKVFEIFAEKVDSFSIDDRKFIQRKVSFDENESNLIGFTELLVDNKNLRLFKKLRKSKISRIKDRTVYFEYNWIKPTYYILYDGKIYEVRKKKDFIDIFPQFKTELKEIKIKRDMIKNNPDSEVLIFSNKIISLLSS